MLKDIWLLMIGISFICLFISLLLFFVWKVPSILDELSGRKEKRQVKLMREMSSKTGTFGGLSTSEVYSSMPSGSLISAELGNIKVSDTLRGVQDDDVATSDMEESSETSFMPDEDFETSYIGVNSDKDKNEYIIKVLEEQSSL